MQSKPFETPDVPFDRPLISLDQPFKDARGEIQPLVDAVMQSAVLIRSNKGTVRANHFHKSDWHYCYVLSGKIEYFYRPTHSSETPKSEIIQKGQLFYTPPMADHAMHFLEDTEFLCLGGNPRDQASYEADIERIELFSPKK